MATLWGSKHPMYYSRAEMSTSFEEERKVMTNLDSILNSRDITLPTKVCLVKAMVFPVVMYGCQSWTVKKAERRRIDAFEPWCWRRFLWVLWTARKSNESILKVISPGCSLEGLMLKLKLQYYSAIKKNTFESVLMRWMKLEPIIQSEVSQKEKCQYSILTHIYGI